MQEQARQNVKPKQRNDIKPDEAYGLEKNGLVEPH
jgi:hypothetical protein